MKTRIGCLGSHIIEVLYDKRDELGVTEIVVLDLQDRITWASEQDNARIKGYCKEWIVGSVTDPNVVSRAVRGCTAVIHSASIVDTGKARLSNLLLLYIVVFIF